MLISSFNPFFGLACLYHLYLAVMLYATSILNHHIIMFLVIEMLSRIWCCISSTTFRKSLKAWTFET
ncbi:hypothetical protein Hanom_Chr07g00592411 [Helianthus anomalus]